MKKKNLIKIVPLIAITLIALTTGFSSIAFADATTTAPSTTSIKHGMHGMFGTSTASRRGGRLAGTVTEINGSALSVKDAKGTIFSVDASSAKLFKDFASTTIAITDIQVGDLVMVRGTTVGTTIKAVIVIDGKFSMAGMPHGKGVFKGERGLKKGFGIRGVVSTISGTTLTVNGANSISYSVDASGATVFKGMPKATSTFAEIKSGDSVMIRGAVTGNTVVATEIIDGIPALGLHHRNKMEKGVQD